MAVNHLSYVEGPMVLSRSEKANKVRELFIGWKVASFILGLVFSQNLAHIVAISNLMPYLMNVLEEELPQAAATTNIRMGVTATMAICGAFLADEYIGRYQIVLYSTIVYIAGLSLITLSASNLLLKTTSAHIGMERITIFRVALLLVALGKAGHAPVLKAFGADQFTSGSEELEDDRVRRRVKFWWSTGVFSGAVAGIVLLALIEGKQDWLFGFGVLALTMLVTFGVFICGKPVYRFTEPGGSVLRRASCVCVAAMLKRHLNYPPNGHELYYHGDSNHLTDSLRFLNKAAYIESQSPNLEEQRNNWRLCTVAEVEETKLLLRMFPMWITFLVYGLVRSLGSTFFLQQGSNMDRNIGSIMVPLPSLLIFSKFSSTQIGWHCVKLSKKLPEFAPILTPTGKIGIGMVFSVLCCSVAALVETKRLGVVKQHGLVDKPKDTLPMNVFWLAPQFLLLGAMDGFIYPSIKNFFCSQVPKSMKNFGPSFSVSVIGIGSLLTVIVIAASDKASRQGGRPSWFADTINRSRLDYFYWTLTVLSCINLVFYGLLSSTYTYKRTSAEGERNGYYTDAISV